MSNIENETLSVLKELLGERGHRTDGSLLDCAARCLHLSRGDKDLIALRGHIISRLSNKPATSPVSTNAAMLADHPYHRIAGLQGIGDAADYLARYPGSEYGQRHLSERITSFCREHGVSPVQGIDLVPAGWTIVQGEELRIVGPIEGPGGLVMDKPGKSLESRLLYALATALIEAQRDAAPGLGNG